MTENQVLVARFITSKTPDRQAVAAAFHEVLREQRQLMELDENDAALFEQDYPTLYRIAAMIGVKPEHDSFFDYDWLGIDQNEPPGISFENSPVLPGRPLLGVVDAPVLNYWDLVYSAEVGGDADWSPLIAFLRSLGAVSCCVFRAPDDAVLPALPLFPRIEFSKDELSFLLSTLSLYGSIVQDRTDMYPYVEILTERFKTAMEDSDALSKGQ